MLLLLAILVVLSALVAPLIQIVLARRPVLAKRVPIHASMCSVDAEEEPGEVETLTHVPVWGGALSAMPDRT